MAASAKALETLHASRIEIKKARQEDLAQIAPALPEGVGAEALESLKEAKKKLQEDLQSLNKALAPHKLWAKNEGIKELL